MEATEARVNIDINQENHKQTVPTVGLVTHPESAKHKAKNAITAISRDIFHNSVIPSNMANLLVLM